MAQQLNADDRSSGPGQDDDKKVFVGGLGWNITENELREYFTQYGEIENINIKTHPFSGQPRGFAFVQFVNSKSVDDLLAAGDHFIANKKVDPQRAIRKVNPMHCKIFVRGLTSKTTEEDVRNHFVQFGQISEYHQPFDKIKNQKKGYCFITFKDSEAVNQILKNPKQAINGNRVYVIKFKLNPETMTTPGAWTGPVGGARAPVTIGLRSVDPGYMAPAAVSPYGTAAYYGYSPNPYGGYDYSEIFNGGGGYLAQAHQGATYP